MTDGELGRRYRTFVQPQHPLIDDVWRGCEDGARRGEPVAQVVSALKRRVAYTSRRGRRDFDDLLREVRARREGRVPMNCINCACVAASMLRRAGYSTEEAFVALGGRRGHGHFHAWTLIVRPPGAIWIDPSTLDPQSVTGDWIAGQHEIHAIFNDARFAFQERDKRALLSGRWA